MSDYDYLDQPSPIKRFFSGLWNVLTILVLLVTLAVAVVFLVVFINPHAPINPFPPPELPPAAALPTATPTPLIQLPPTWTPSPTSEPTATHTPKPTSTSPPTVTPFSLFPASPTPVQTQITTGKPFVVGPGTPLGTSSQAFHPDKGCNWLGVAGQVFDLTGRPLSGLQVRVKGVLAGKPVDLLSLTGVTAAYGTEGFYEFELNDQPVASHQALWVQLEDQGGLPMSDKITFDTFDNCEKNLIFVNFVQVR